MVGSREKLRQLFSLPLYGNALYLMLNTAVTSFLGFFFWMIVARFYTEAEVGLGSALISLISLLALFSQLGLNLSLIRFLPHSEKPEEMINTSLTLGGLVSLLVVGIFLAGLGFWSPALSFITQNTIFSLAFVAFVLFGTLSLLLASIFIAGRRAQFVLSKNALFSLLKLPLPIAFVLFFHTFGIVSSWGVATGVALAIALFLFLPRVQRSYRLLPTLKLGLIKDMWRYSAGSYLASLFAAAPALVLPVMVVNLIGAQSNAYFYIAWMIAGLLFAIPAAASQSLFAESSHFEERLRENVARSLRFTFLLLVPALIVLVLAGKWLLLLFGEGYSANALELLWVLGLSSILVGINSIYISILRVRDRIRDLVLIYGFLSGAVLIASYFIMPTMGIVSIGYAWAGAQGVVAVYFLSRRPPIQRYSPTPR